MAAAVVRPATEPEESTMQEEEEEAQMAAAAPRRWHAADPAGSAAPAVCHPQNLRESWMSVRGWSE